MLRASAAIALTCLGLGLAGIGASGCGGDSADTQTQTPAQKAQSQISYELKGEAHHPGNAARYAKLLDELRTAALSGRHYDAIAHAKSLDVPTKAAIYAFCDFAWQILANNEEEKLHRHVYIGRRITSLAEFKVAPSSRPDVHTAMAKLRAVINLTSLSSAKRVRAYKIPCYS